MVRYRYILCFAMLLSVFSSSSVLSSGILCPPGFAPGGYEDTYVRCSQRGCDKGFKVGREICGITYLAELDSLESRETIFYEIKETLEIKKEEIFLIKEPLVTGNHPLFESYDPVRHKPQRIGNAKDWQRIYDEQISIVRKHEWEIFRIYGMGPVIRALIVAALFWLFIRTSGKTNWGKFLLSIIIFLMIVVCCLHFEASPKNFLRPENYILRNMILFPTLTLVAMVLIRKVGKRVSKKKE